MTGFGQRLLEAMDRKKITAAELSRMSGVGKNLISYYLNGKYLAKQDKVYLLAEALDVDPGWLVTGVQQVVESDPWHFDLQHFASGDTDQDRLEALHQNPQLGMLFDRSRKMSKEDVDFMLQMADRILKEREE